MRRQREPLKLTKTVIDGLVCPPGRKDLLFFDADLKGFAVRVTSSGARLFLFQYRDADGRVRRISLGEYGPVTAVQARKRAEIHRGEVSGGGDPVAERKAEVEEARRQREAEALTFKVLVETWRDLKLGDRRASYRLEAVRALLSAFPAWQARPAVAILPAEVGEALDRIRRDQGPYAALRALAYGRAMFNWARSRHLLASNPFAGLPAPAAAVARDRVLSDPEVGEVWRAAEKLGWPYGPFVRLLLLTLQRRDEVAGMRWSEISADGTTWTIPAERAKNNRAHVVHLSSQVRTILEHLKEGAITKARGEAGMRQLVPDLIFTTTGKTPISGFSRARDQVDRKIAAERKTMGRKPPPLPAWRLHDFRRTGVTRLAALGFPPHICDRLLNHVQGAIQGVAAVYQRHEFLAEREKALDAWANHVLAVSGEASPSPA